MGYCILFKSMSRTVYSERTIRQEIDFQSGEINSETQERIIVKKVAQSEFVRVYVSDLMNVLNFADLTITDVKVLGCVWEIARFDTGEVILVKPKKESIAETVGCTLGAVEKAIQRLHRAQLILREGEGRHGIYRINPKYFWKGSEESRQKSMKLTIKYQFNDENIIELYPSSEKE